VALQDLEATLAGTDALERSNPIHDVNAWRPGDRIGRYVVLERLGTGAMGVVLAAYDPALDRRVAIKLIHDPGVPGSPNVHRKLREAQTLARLSHPNVVAVHDVGEIEDSSVVFIAMEYIAGCTLKRWLEEPRSVGEIVGVFLQAGRGLAAAHAAAVIHRDFKPANVMIGDDPHGVGRVRVMDFGLARAQLTDPTHVSDGYSQAGTRATAGTPAYMAPEQHLERTVGPAADQFAFCVALHEALVGSRPFVGESPAEIAYSVTHDAPAPAPRTVPENVRRVLERGLAREPEQRFPSMEALLRELARDPRRARRRWLGASGAVLAFSGVLLALRDPDATCERLADEFDEVWAPQHRGELRSAITAAANADVSTRTIEELDRFAAGWRAQRSAACIDARRGTTEPELVDRRNACLEHARQQFGAIVETLAHDAAEQTFEVLGILPSLRDCADGKVLRLVAPTPADPETRAEVLRVRGLLARVVTLELAGRLDDAQQMLARAELDGAELGDEALLAEIELARGRVLVLEGDFEHAAQVLAAAVWTALRSRHEAVAIRAAMSLVYVTGDHLRDTAAAELWFALAQSLLVAADAADSPLWGDLWSVRGAMLLRAHRHDEARDASERAVEIGRRTQNPRLVSLALQYIALSQRELKQFDRSNETATEAIGVLRDAFGEGHPMIGMLQGVIGANFLALDEPERAASAMREGLDSLELTLPATHFKVVETRWNLCLCSQFAGRHGEMIACIDDMLGTVRDDPELAASWMPTLVEYLLIAAVRSGDFARVDRIVEIASPTGEVWKWSDIAYAEIAMLEGRVTEAERRLEGRIAALDRRQELGSVEAFWARYALARVALRELRVERADAMRAELEGSGDDSERTDSFLDALAGRVWLAMGEPRRALPTLAAATAALDGDVSTRYWAETAEAFVALARTHAALGSDRAEMLQAAHRALAIYERLPGYRSDRDAFAAWLAGVE
jgi:tetratricopeptide (TPR) repeat protein